MNGYDTGGAGTIVLDAINKGSQAADALRRNDVLNSWVVYARKLEKRLFELEAEVGEKDEKLQAAKREAKEFSDKLDRLHSYVNSVEEHVTYFKKLLRRQSIDTAAVKAMYDLLVEELNAAADPDSSKTFDVESRHRYVNEQVEAFKQTGQLTFQANPAPYPNANPLLKKTSRL